MHRGGWALAAAMAACTTSAWAAPRPLDADPMTVSGRFAVAHADATVVRGRLKPRTVLAATLPDMLDWDAEAFHAALDKAVMKSLDNFGYDAGPDASAVTPVTVELAGVQIERQDKATVAKVRLRLRADAGADACLTQEASGQFTALRPVRTGDGQRVFAVAATIGLAVADAAMGAMPSSAPNTFLYEQFDTATAQTEAINARRVTGQGEGVAPDRSEKGAARYAAATAVQLALAALIDRLGQADACRPEAGAVSP
jgi:hypothetical protein